MKLILKFHDLDFSGLKHGSKSCSCCKVSLFQWFLYNSKAVWK